MAQNHKYLRFSLSDRVEHWVLTLSFTTLAITGLVQKYATGSLSKWVIDLLGGIESTRLIHRYAAILLMLEVVYHLGVVGYRVFVRRVRLTMLPGLQDVQTAIQAMLYNVGLRQDRPQQGRYTFEEKAEYWAVVWGTVIMVITGFMLWNPIATARFLPGEIIPAAKAAHGGEALLATLAIIIWHIYGVHVRVFNKSMFRGYLTEEEMLEEHPVELAEIKAGVAERTVEPQVLQRRRRAFWGVYGAVAIALLVGIFWFVSFEESAITTVPPAEDVVVFAPLTPTPFPTPLPTSTPRPTQPPDEAAPEAGLTWQGGVADLFQQKCGACHGEANALGGLNLGDYQAALAGGDSGPAIEPGDPDASSLVALMAQGGHPGQLSADELAQVRQWIESGAPEAEAPEVEGLGAGADLRWPDVADLFQQKCVACHSESNALGGLNLSSYEAVLAGGNAGPAVEPGDPEASGLVTLQAAGGHPGQFSADELELIRQWIAEGAME